MKKILAVLAGLFIFLVILHLGLFFLINAKGKDFIVRALEDNLKREVSLDSFSLKFPFEIEIINLRSGDMSLERVSATLSFYNPFSSKLTLNKVHVDGLNLIIAGPEQGLSIVPVIAEVPVRQETDTAALSKPKSQAPSSRKSPKAGKLKLAIKKIYIKDSSVKIINLGRKGPGSLTIEDINLRLKDFVYPQLSKFQVEGKASIKTGRGDLRESVSLAGWVDYQNLNMDVDLNILAIDYLTISNFLSGSFSPESLGIDEAFLSLSAKVKSKNNDMAIDGLLIIDQIVFLPKAEGQESNPNQDMVKTVLALLKGSQEKASLRFKLKTKMNSPKLDFTSIGKNLASSLPINPAAFVKGAFNQAMDRAAAKAESPEEVTIDNVVDSFKEIGESFKNIFKRK